jgi:predicted ribosomally synthesized peptide with nif11-like leader
MSLEEAKRFEADIKSNADLAGEFKGISDLDAMVAKANEKGYDFSAADARKAAPANAELSDDELDGAAGGLSVNTNGSYFISNGHGSWIAGG